MDLFAALPAPAHQVCRLPWPGNSQLPHAMVECRAFDAKLPGCPLRTADHPANLFQSPHNQSTFGLPKSCWDRRSNCNLGRGSQRIWKHTTLREYDGALNQIFQFTDIPRPIVLDKRSHCRFRYFVDSLADLAAAQVDEMPNQQFNIFMAVP